jgi:hypothetical protein
VRPTMEQAKAIGAAAFPEDDDGATASWEGLWDGWRDPLMVGRPVPGEGAANFRHRRPERFDELAALYTAGYWRGYTNAPDWLP